MKLNVQCLTDRGRLFHIVLSHTAENVVLNSDSDDFYICRESVCEFVVAGVKTVVGNLHGWAASIKCWSAKLLFAK